MNDVQIIDLFWERKESAIQAVSDKYTPFCYKIAWNILSNREDSEECVNDTWYAAWRYIPPKRPRVLSAFLGKLTRGFAIDAMRRRYAGRRMDLHMADVFEEAESLSRAMGRNHVEEYMEEQELVKVINQFLYSLREEDRDIFIRRYWYMDSIGDIAKRHECGESKVKSSLFRNRKKLRKVLEHMR